MLKKKLSFIHAADLHLGSRLHTSGITLKNVGEILEKATFQAFTRISQAAITYQVDFLLLAGDVYDQAAKSVKANLFFTEQCHLLQENEIKVYIIAGNHDPLNERRELFVLPENVYLFASDAPETQEFLNQEGEVLVRILGQSYRWRAESRQMQTAFTVVDQNVGNIGLLHTQLDSTNQNYVPCSLNDLKSRAGVNYWALGHIHQCKIIHNANPVVAYPGIPQGRDFGEVGVGGCLHVEVDPNPAIWQPKLSFIPTSPVIWRRMQLDISGDLPKNLSDLEEMLCKKAEELLRLTPPMPDGLNCKSFKAGEEYLEGYIVQWVLSGRCEIHQLLLEQEEEITQVIRDNLRKRFGQRSPFVWTDSVVIRTTNPLPHLNDLQEHNRLFRELAEVVKLALNDQNMSKELIAALGQIWEWQNDHENINEEKFQLSETSLAEIIKQAEELVIQKLLEGRDF